MRTKRSIRTKKTSKRSARPAVAASADSPKKATWGASIDRTSLGVAVLSIAAAGILVAAYKPSAAVEAATPAVAAVETATPAPAATTTATARAATSSPKTIGEPAAEQWPAPLTITGCLERDADEFRLTETSGIGAPKSRSWKSGFFKKSSSSIAVVDADPRSRLQDYVGQRVTVTGTLVNKEMQLGSVRSIAASCDEKIKI